MPTQGALVLCCPGRTAAHQLDLKGVGQDFAAVQRFFLSRGLAVHDGTVSDAYLCRLSALRRIRDFFLAEYMDYFLVLLGHGEDGKLLLDGDDISYNDVHQEFSKRKGKRLVILIDTCHSGSWVSAAIARCDHHIFVQSASSSESKAFDNNSFTKYWISAQTQGAARISGSGWIRLMKPQVFIGQSLSLWKLGAWEIMPITVATIGAVSEILCNESDLLPAFSELPCISILYKCDCNGCFTPDAVEVYCCTLELVNNFEYDSVTQLLAARFQIRLPEFVKDVCICIQRLQSVYQQEARGKRLRQFVKFAKRMYLDAVDPSTQVWGALEIASLARVQAYHNNEQGQVESMGKHVKLAILWWQRALRITEANLIAFHHQLQFELSRLLATVAEIGGSAFVIMKDNFPGAFTSVAESGDIARQLIGMSIHHMKLCNDDLARLGDNAHRALCHSAILMQGTQLRLARQLNDQMAFHKVIRKLRQLNSESLCKRTRIKLHSTVHDVLVWASELKWIDDHQALMMNDHGQMASNLAELHSVHPKSGTQI